MLFELRETRNPTSPQFRYSDSLNPYARKVAESQAGLLANEATEKLQGQWRGLFGADTEARRPLVLEIGCNGGHFLVEKAKRESETLWLGFDWKFKQIHCAGERIQKHGVQNVRFARALAERVPYAFAPGELDGILIYFPDPWPKKSQWKKRVLRREWFTRLYPVLKKSGTLEIKTDHPGYWEMILAELAHVGHLYETIEITSDLHAGNPEAGRLKIPDVTLFERIFIRDGLPVHRVLLKAK